MLQACRKRGGWGALAPQFLAKQFTLSQPGGQIMPNTVLRALPDFQTLRRPCIYYAVYIVFFIDPNFLSISALNVLCLAENFQNTFDLHEI